MQCLVLVRADVISFFFFFSIICEELDRPRTGEEEEKSEDNKEKENEKDAAEKRKIRGEILKSEFQTYCISHKSFNFFWSQSYKSANTR